MTTKPTHARGPGGVALAGASPPTPPVTGFVPLVLWPGTFDPTVGDGYAADPGTIGVSAVAGIAWLKPLAGGPTTWIQLGTVWQLVARFPEIQALCLIEPALVPAMPALVYGVHAAGEIAFPAFADLADNQTVIVGGITYEVQKTGGYVHTLGTVTVDCTACTDENSVAIAFGHAIDTTPGSTVEASGPVGALLTLGANLPGPAGNVPITGTVPADFGGMSGGADPIVNLSSLVQTLQAVAGLYADLTPKTATCVLNGTAFIDAAIAVPGNRAVRFHAEVQDFGVGAVYGLRINGAKLAGHGERWSAGVGGHIDVTLLTTNIDCAIAGNSSPSHVEGEISAVDAVGQRSVRIEIFSDGPGWTAVTRAKIPEGAMGPGGALTSIGIDANGNVTMQSGTTLRANLSTILGTGL